MQGNAFQYKFTSRRYRICVWNVAKRKPRRQIKELYFFISVEKSILAELDFFRTGLPAG